MNDNEEILRAIRDQRWFFFANNDKILFDGKTALVWANLDKFPCYRGENGLYPSQNSYAEVKAVISQTNVENFGGFNDWKIPHHMDLWEMIEDQTFPFQAGPYWRIKEMFSWCVERNGTIAGKDLDNRGNSSGISQLRGVYVIPCTVALKPQNFRGSAKEILDIFTKNELIPIFKDAEVNELYKTLFVDKKSRQIKLAAGFDFNPILANYDADELIASPIKYFAAVANFAENVLDVLREYEIAQIDTISEFSRAAIKLGVRYTSNPHLTEDENSLLAKRQKFLARRLELGTDKIKEQLLALKAQAEKFFARLDEINDGENTIRELAALEVEPRANFALVAENYACLVQNARDRLNFFVQNKDFVLKILSAWETWSNDYKIFKTGFREEFFNSCRKAGVEEEIFNAWYEDWRMKRFEIEKKFLPLAEFALKGNLSESFENALNVLREYRDSLDKFYLHERKNIYVRIFVKSGGALQDKFETDSELCKRAETFRRNIQKVIFSCEKVEERFFLLKWSESLLNMPVDAIISLICERELEGMFEEILSKFEALRQQNFVAYIADERAFDEARKQRDNETNQLIFQMKKGLGMK